MNTLRHLMCLLLCLCLAGGNALAEAKLDPEREAFMLERAETLLRFIRSTLTHQRGKTTRKSLMVLDFRVVSCGLLLLCYFTLPFYCRITFSCCQAPF